MNIYQHILHYTHQLTGDREIAYIITRDVTERGVQLAIDLWNADRAIQWMLVTARNKCYDYNRWADSEEGKAAKLNVAVGAMEQEIRGIREGRFI